MSETAEDAKSDVKTVEEVLKSSGNDELKFGLLIGLIKVNQVGDKDVVNTVLHLVCSQCYLLSLLLMAPSDSKTAIDTLTLFTCQNQ